MANNTFKIKERPTKKPTTEESLEREHEFRHLLASVVSSPKFRGEIKDRVAEIYDTRYEYSEDIAYIKEEIRILRVEIKKKGDWFALLKEKVGGFELK